VLPPGDMNAEGTVDFDDITRNFSDKSGCRAGPETPVTDLVCGPADFNGDGFIDLRDIADFQNWFGANIENE
jgi:hypothetical protein